MHMRKASLIAALAVAGAVALPERVEAQQAPRAAQVTVGDLMAALDGVNVQLTRLAALGALDVRRVRLVDVRDVLTDADVAAFDDALDRNRVEVLNLRNVLNDSEVIRKALADNQVPIAVGQVVAIDVLGGGGVIVFYRPAARE